MIEKLVLTNTAFQTIARIISSGISFIITIVIAKSFGVFGYGDFTKVTAYVGLFYVFVDFGLNAIFLQKDKDGEHFKNLLYPRLIAGVILVILINAIAALLPFDKDLGLGFSPQVRQGIFLYSFYLLMQGVILSATAIFQRTLRYDRLFFATTLGSVGTLIATGFVAFFHLQILFLYAAFIFGGLLSAGASLISVEKKILPFSLNSHFIKQMLRESFPLGLMLVFNLVYFRSDMILLSIYRSTSEVGIYGFAYKFFDFLIALPLFLSNAVYPLLLERQKNYRTFFLTVHSYLVLFIFFSILFGFIAWFLSPLVSLVKADFSPAIIPFRILILSLPFFFGTSFLQWVLIAKKKQRYLLFVYFFSTVLNILLNMLYIPFLGYIASSIITVISEGIVFILLLLRVYFLRKSFS